MDWVWRALSPGCRPRPSASSSALRGTAVRCAARARRTRSTTLLPAADRSPERAGRRRRGGAALAAPALPRCRAGVPLPVARSRYSRAPALPRCGYRFYLERAAPAARRRAAPARRAPGGVDRRPPADRPRLDRPRAAGEHRLRPAHDAHRGGRRGPDRALPRARPRARGRRSDRTLHRFRQLPAARASLAADHVRTELPFAFQLTPQRHRQ